MPAVLDRLIERPRDKHHEARRHATAYKVLAVFALIALVMQTSMLFLSLFEQPLPYAIKDPGPESIDSPQFLQVLAAQTGGALTHNNRIDVLANGDTFYAAELAAIRSAQSFVHIECYIFQKGRVTDEFLNALEERAQAGVQVDLVIDAIGSTAFRDSRFDRLRQLGGRVAWYHPLRWYSWPRINNRTHRELVIVDGKVGFAGGAGFADQWLYGAGKDPRWRDTMVRVEGEGASGLEATFDENWLEASGEMLIDPKYLPFEPGGGTSIALAVTSSPTSGRSTEARVLFQALLAKAAHSIHITNPYFLPDRSLREELGKAIRERHVDVTILVPGAKNDHLLTRRSSRNLYGDLLLAGARIFEYQPSMIHAKITLVDGSWAVVGSTNLDSRSFGLNDEVNVAIPDRTVTARLESDFQNDLRSSRRISYDQWKHRPWWEKLQEKFGWLLENQE
ncbi:MAG TPA: phospholipase D-like domain-containing protein [Bryobacteraceae bacterium]